MHPIVGEVSSDQIIFLVKSVKSESVTISFKNYDIQSKKMIDDKRLINIVPNIATRIVLGNINFNKNKILFTIDIDDKKYQHLIGNKINKIIIISCDMPVADAEHSLWNDISNENSDLVCHIGDNIYGDATYHSKNANYDQLYVDTWNIWSPLLKDSSHLMIGDDHEVKNNFDITQLDQNDSKQKKALDAYNCYQATLANVPSNEGVLTKLINDVKLILISRSLCLENLVDRLIKEVGNETGNLIVAFSSAPIILPTNLCGKLYNSILGGTGWKEPDLFRLYDFCFQYMEKNNAKIILVGGDLHDGFEETIYYQKLELPIFVSSAITNYATPFEKLIISGISSTEQINKYRIVISAKAKRNYLVIENGKPTLKYGSSNMPKKILPYFKELIKMI